MEHDEWKRPLKFIRSLLFIAKQRLVGFGPPGEPGLDDETTALFFELLEKSKSYLEFGSGGTTLAAARFGVPTVSVEADRFFARAVRKALPPGAKVKVIDIDLGVTKEWSTPLFVRVTPKRIARWRRYVEAPFERLEPLFPFPDFVLVDGRFRRACALKVAREASLHNARVSLLVDDYFTPGREHYADVEHWLGSPRRHGRGALFEIEAGSSGPPEDAIRQAAEDYR